VRRVPSTIHSVQRILHACCCAGAVYKVKWRGQEIALKEISLPQERPDASAAARRQLEKELRGIRDDFVQEVEVCCDLNHPNLVQLMGYATSPCLLIAQELLQGQSLDMQLYVEMWQPDGLQVQKVALDVAEGMHYLHTAFKEDGSQVDLPIIHRDLKSANLILVAPPPPAGAGIEGITAKVTAAVPKSLSLAWCIWGAFLVDTSRVACR
jgi:serine/threonine protein kinase